MNDFNKLIVATLSEVLPTYYDAFVTDQAVPCITYMPTDNYIISRNFDRSMIYSIVRYQIKLWADSIEDILTYSAQLDQALTDIYLNRTNMTEMTYNGRICRIFTYEGLTFEKNNN